MSSNKENKYILELDNKIKDLVTERQKVIHFIKKIKKFLTIKTKS